MDKATGTYAIVFRSKSLGQWGALVILDKNMGGDFRWPTEDTHIDEPKKFEWEIVLVSEVQ